MLHFIVAPYHLGKRNAAVGAGPLRIVESGIAERLGVPITEIDVGVHSDWIEVNRHLTAAVREARSAGKLPLVLAGNCNSCVGTLAGLKDAEPGILWFDAHGDFHTPETSQSGSIEGMSLTLATRDFVPESKVVLIGSRALESGEDQRVRSRLRYVPDAKLDDQANLPQFESAYIHVDIDVLDPSISPGVNFQGPGGLTVEELMEALTVVFQRHRVAALAIANYHAARDTDNRTLSIVVGLIEHIGRLHKAAATR